MHSGDVGCTAHPQAPVHMCLITHSAATGTLIRLGGVLWVRIPASGIPRVGISPSEIPRRECVL